MLQYRSNTKKLVEYVEEHKRYFQNIDQDTFFAIREFLHSKSQLKKALAKVKVEKEEKVDMCKALDDLYNMGVEKGREEMRNVVDESYNKGVEKGREESQRFEKLTRILLEAGKAEELLKATKDTEFKEKLYLEYFGNPLLS